MPTWGIRDTECKLEDAQACVGPGWASLVERLWKLCDEQNIHIMQIKEKFGGLRFYIGGATKEVFDIIDEVEAQSFTICEYCGKPGRPRDGGWIKTLCDECYSRDE